MFRNAIAVFIYLFIYKHVCFIRVLARKMSTLADSELLQTLEITKPILGPHHSAS